MTTHKENKYSGIINTPFGWCGVVKGPLGVKRIFIGFKSKKTILSEIRRQFPHAEIDEGLTREELRSIENYLQLKTKNIVLNLDFSESTPFEKMVYRTLCQVPYGKVITYKNLAIRCGSSSYARAVARALAKNPFPLAVPCHRVIRSDGKIGGFSSPGGTGLKKKLIELERDPVAVSRGAHRSGI